MPEINWLAAIVAGIAGFFVGGLWYSPLMFAKFWSKYVGFDPASPGGYPMPVAMGGGAALSIIAAIVFAMFLGPQPPFAFAVGAGLAAGIAWVGTSIFINGFFERKNVELMLINTGYHTVQFAVFGAILGIWH